MKFSTKHPDFPWFAEMQCMASDLMFFVDDVPQDFVVAFDTEEGWLERQKVIGGKVQVDRSSGEIMTERLEGRVEVKRRKQVKG